MAKRKNEATPKRKPTKKPKPEPIPRLYIRKGDSLKTIYAKFRKAFTAADLQKYTVTEEMFPVLPLLEELEAADRAWQAKRKRKKNGR